MLSPLALVAAGAVIQGAILGDAVEVHENAYIAEGAAIGDRSIVGHDSVVANNVKVYPFKTIEAGAVAASGGDQEAAAKLADAERRAAEIIADVAVMLASDLYSFVQEGALVPAQMYLDQEEDAAAWLENFYPSLLATALLGGGNEEPGDGVGGDEHVGELRPQRIVENRSDRIDIGDRAVREHACRPPGKIELLDPVSVHVNYPGI